MRLRIATLNTWAKPAPLSVQPIARMTELARRLAPLELDVIALQELWTRGARRALREACAPAGLVHTWSTHATLGGSGLFVLSRLPLANTRFSSFAVRGYPERVDHGDYYGGKGFASVEIQHPEGSLTLLNTHLHARYASDVEHSYVPQRIAQIVQLAAGVWRSPGPTLAVGDFNFTEQDVEHHVLTGLTGLRDVAAVLDQRQPTALGTNPYRGRRSSDRRIDYVFARDGGGARVVPLRIERVLDEIFPLDGRYASVSDHAGLLAEVEVTPGAQGDTGLATPDAVALAREWLARGRLDAARRRDDARRLAGVGLACTGVLAVGQSRLPAISRRRLLRGGAKGLALLALPPTLGLSLFSELEAPDDLRAFDVLEAQLGEAPLARI